MPIDETASRARLPASARELVMDVLGVERVAAWCDVSKGAVYQWLSRATDDAPIPQAHVLPILLGMLRDEVRADLGVMTIIAILWPPLREVRL